MLRQLYFGAMDIELHSPNYDPFGDKTIFDLQHEMADKYDLWPMIDSCARSATFSLEGTVPATTHTNGRVSY
jgi:Zn-dependent oligopeptidase